MVLVGLHLATASWAVGDSATARRKLHSSVLVISAMEGDVYFRVWSILLAMSAIPSVRKLPSAPQGSPPFHGLRMMVELAHTERILMLKLLSSCSELSVSSSITKINPQR